MVRTLRLPVVAVVCLGLTLTVHAQSNRSDGQAANNRGSRTTPKAEVAANRDQLSAYDDARSVLTEAEWRRVDAAVRRALAYMAGEQGPEGEFPGGALHYQPGVTGLGVMAFIAAGEVPAKGQYGDTLAKSVDFLLDSQQPSGMFSLFDVEPYRVVPRSNWDETAAHAWYNHAIAGLTLSEVYGMVDAKRRKRIAVAIEKGLKNSRKYQITDKLHEGDLGGWRYMFRNNGMDSDLSVTAWQLMFFRSAKNSGFNVPKEMVDDAMGYVRRTYDPRRKKFRYCLFARDARYTRAMSGAGIFALAMGGEHGSEMATDAADWVLSMADSFRAYRTNAGIGRGPQTDQYHYSAYHCTQAMYQMGGKYWAGFYPPLAMTLVDHQIRDGGWAPENLHQAMGRSYTTALCTLVLTVADQQTPIFQR